MLDNCVESAEYCGNGKASFALPVDDARAKARAWLDAYPAAAYMSAVESWRTLPDGQIEFTMRPLRTAD